MADVTIFHNPACGTSRDALALIRSKGSEPRVVDYLKTPPTRETLRGLADRLDGGVRALLRAKEPLYEALGLGDARRGEDELLDALVAHPRLLNRPVVSSPRGTKVCRPAQAVLPLLDD